MASREHDDGCQFLVAAWEEGVTAMAEVTVKMCQHGLGSGSDAKDATVWTVRLVVAMVGTEGVTVVIRNCPMGKLIPTRVPVPHL